VATLAARHVHDAVGFMARRDHHALRGTEARALHARHVAVARQLVGRHAQPAAGEGGQGTRDRVADVGHVALAPGALLQRPLLVEVGFQRARGLGQQRVPAVHARWQQVGRALLQHRPDHTFQLRKPRRQVVIPQARLGRCQQRALDGFKHFAAETTHDAVAGRACRGAGVPVSAGVGQTLQRRIVAVRGGFLQQPPPALQ